MVKPKILDKEIVNYISKEIEDGFSRHKIRKALLKAGHSKEVVEEYLSFFEDKSAKTIKKTFKVIFWSVVAIAIIILISSLTVLSIRFIKSEKQKIDALYPDALSKMSVHDYKGAIKDLKKYVFRKGTNLDVELAFAKAYEKLGEHKKSLQHLEQAYHIDPSKVDHLTLGRLYFKMNKTNEALMHLKQVKDKRNKKQALEIESKINEKQGNLLESIKNLKEIERKDSGDYYEIGRIYYRLNMINESSNYLNKAIMHGQKEPMVWYYLSKCYFTKGDLENSTMAITNALKYRIDNEFASMAAKIYDAKGEKKIAQMYRESIK